MFKARAQFGLLALCVPLCVAGFGASVKGEQLPGDGLQPAHTAAFAELQSFVCDERVERFRSRIDSSHRRHIDTLSARISFEGGAEQYASVRQNERSLTSFSEASGAWSVGEYGTLLRQTAGFLSSRLPDGTSAGMWNGEPVTIFTFSIKSAESPWNLVLEGGGAQPVPFETSVWVSGETGNVVRVVRVAEHLPAQSGITRIEWTVSLKASVIRNAAWLVPDWGEYSVSYAGLDRQESNLIYFSNYRRYASEATIRYGD